MSFELDDRKVAELIQMCEGRHLFVTRQENILSLCLVLFCVDFKRCTLQHSGEGTLELLDPDTHMIYVCAYADRHTQTRIKYRHRRNTQTQAQHGHICRCKRKRKYKCRRNNNAGRNMGSDRHVESDSVEKQNNQRFTVSNDFVNLPCKMISYLGEIADNVNDRYREEDRSRDPNAHSSTQTHAQAHAQKQTQTQTRHRHTPDAGQKKRMGGHPQPHTHTNNSPCIHLASARFFKVSEFGVTLSCYATCQVGHSHFLEMMEPDLLYTAIQNDTLDETTIALLLQPRPVCVCAVRLYDVSIISIAHRGTYNQILRKICKHAK